MSNYTGTFVPSTDNNPWNKAFDLVRDESTVLDIGCSTGNFGEALKKYKNCVFFGHMNNGRKEEGILHYFNGKCFEGKFKEDQK